VTSVRPTSTTSPPPSTSPSPRWPCRREAPASAAQLRRQEPQRQQEEGTTPDQEVAHAGWSLPLRGEGRADGALVQPEELLDEEAVGGEALGRRDAIAAADAAARVATLP